MPYNKSDPSSLRTALHTQKEITEYWENNIDGTMEATETFLEKPGKVGEAIVHFLGTRRRLNVLDVGTGGGAVAILLAMLGHSVTAMDISAKILDRAKRNFLKHKVTIKTILGDCCDTGLPDDSYDVVIARNVLFTLPDANSGYSEWRRIVRPGGKVLVFDGNYFIQADLEEYRRAFEYLGLKYGDWRGVYGNDLGDIDYVGLQKLAVDLQPNRVRRPSWDLWNLLYANMDFITVHCIDDDNYWMWGRLGHLKIYLRYALCATKPLSASDSTQMAPGLRTDGAYNQTVKVMEALGNGVRLGIIGELMECKRTSAYLRYRLGLKSNLLNYHMKILSDAGVITSRKTARTVTYALADRDLVVAILNSSLNLLMSKRE